MIVHKKEEGEDLRVGGVDLRTESRDEESGVAVDVLRLVVLLAALLIALLIGFLQTGGRRQHVMKPFWLPGELSSMYLILGSTVVIATGDRMTPRKCENKKIT